MAAPTPIFKGLAAFEGVAGAFDVIIYPLQQTMKLTQNFDLEEVKDFHGADYSWVARNEHYPFDVAMKLVDITGYPTGAGSTHAHAVAGAAFLAPLAKVVVSGCEAAVMNGSYQVINGADIDLANTKIGDITFKMRRYANADQNTAATTSPA